MNPYLEQEEKSIINDYKRATMQQNRKNISYHRSTILMAYIACMLVFITTMLNAQFSTYHDDQYDDLYLFNQYHSENYTKKDDFFIHCSYCGLITRHDSGKSPSNSWQCPKCGFPNFNDIRYCGVCGEPKPVKNNFKENIFDK